MSKQKHTARQIRFVGGDLINQPSCTTSLIVLDIVYNMFFETFNYNFIILYKITVTRNIIFL